MATLPKWLAEVTPREETDPAWRRRVGYWRQRYQATPPWANTQRIAQIYKEAERRRKFGMDVVVDHIIPLKHPHVCGLHCEHNLVIIPRLENAAKSNHTWPGKWAEQTTFDIPHRLQQLTLEV